MSVIQSDIGASLGVAGATGRTQAFGATTVTGHTLVVAASMFATAGAGNFNTPTDNKGNTYTASGTELTISTSLDVHMWYCINATGGTGHTVTFTHGATTVDITTAVVELDAGAFDQNNQATGNTNAPSSGAITTVTNADLIGVCGTDQSDASEPNPGVGWTEIELLDGTGAVPLEVEHRADFDGAATWSTVNPHPWAAKVASFAPVGGGPEPVLAPRVVIVSG